MSQLAIFRSSERSYRLPIVIWLVAVFFSIASNFNFLYSNFMRDDVTETTVTKQIEIFRNDLVENARKGLRIRMPCAVQPP